MFGSFAHGTVPPLRPYSLASSFVPTVFADRLPRPIAVADCSVTRFWPRFRYLAVVRLLAQHRSPFRFSLIGSLPPVPPGDCTSSPEVTRCSSVPCHPQTPWYGGVNENAFASIVQARPSPPLADRFIVEVAPIDYGPVLLLMPFGFHLTMDTLPSGEPQESGSRSALAVSGFRLRARLGFSIPSFSLRPARHYPRFWI
jgi:hypothetical protein